MDPKALSTLCAQVYKQYPAVNGIRPRVQERAGGLFQISFRAKKTTADGKPFPVVIRVTSDANGKISKIAESH